nr:LytTR family DNA-binding domain-containing protein [Allomuricauda sp.]
MKYTVLLVDDEQEALNRLKFHLEKFPELGTVHTCNDGFKALKKIEGTKPDIVFMDIEMPEMSGIEVLRHCKEPYPYFIFVTAYNQYAIEAFEENAIDYILKPYTPERIDSALQKAIQMTNRDRLAEKAESYKDVLTMFAKKTDYGSDTAYIKRIAVKSIGRTSFIDVDDIVLIEAADQYVEIETPKKKYTVRESMDQLEKTLDPDQFFRTHRSFIINLNQVEAMETVDKHISLVILKNKRKAKISNSRKPDFKKKMNF